MKKQLEDILTDLEKIGIKLNSIQELKLANDPIIIPVVVSYISQLSEQNYKEFLLSSLGKKGFDEAIPFLLKEFYTSNPLLYKWSVGSTIYNIKPAEKLYVEEMKKIALDKSLGMSRQMIVLALGKSKNESVIPTLVTLLDDPDVHGHALEALLNFKNQDLKMYFERFLDSDKAWIRNNAKKGLSNLN